MHDGCFIYMVFLNLVNIKFGSEVASNHVSLTIIIQSGPGEGEKFGKVGGEAPEKTKKIMRYK